MPGEDAHRKYWRIIALLSAFAFFAVDRFYRITEIGMTGSDQFIYWEIAADWFEGNITLTSFYRPVLYLLFNSAMHIFGKNDYAIKIINASLDMLTILFVFLTARKLTKNFLFSIAACSLYALLPAPLIYAARSELSQATTTFFVAGGIYGFTWYYEKGRIGALLETCMLFVSGFMLGCAANAHPEIALVGPAFIMLLLKAHVDNNNTRLSQIIFALGLFTLAFFVPYICVGWYFGFGEAVNGLLKNYAKFQISSSGKTVGFLTALNEIQRNFFALFASGLMKYVFVGTIAVNVILLKIRSKRSTVAIFLLPMLFHYIGYCVFVPRYDMARLFMPWLPFILLYTCYWLHELTAVLIKNKKAAAIVFVMLWAFLAVYHRSSYARSVFVSRQQEISAYREVHDALKSKYERNRRVLMTPLLLYSTRYPLRTDVYFGSAAEYLSEASSDGLDRALTGYGIRYLVIFKVQFDTRKLQKHDFYYRARIYYNLDREEYSVEKEIQFLKDYAIKHNGSLIYESEQALIYEIKPPPVKKTIRHPEKVRIGKVP